MVESTPITLNGTDYELRFEQEDVMACEAELKMGYIYFFRVEDGVPVTMSLMLCRTLIHHGLRIKDKKGELDYAFAQGPAGAKDAGNLIGEFMRSGGSMGEIWMRCYDAFAEGWFPKKPVESAPDKVPEPEKTSKNSRGTGQRPQNRTPSGSAD